MSTNDPLSTRDLVFGKLLLIYQMPKVGSQTLEATLLDCPINYRILRFHHLSNVLTTNAKRALKSSVSDEAWKEKARPQIDLSVRVTRAIRWRKILTRCGVTIPKLQIIT